MLSKIILAVIAGVVAYIVCMVLGTVLIALSVPVAVTVGALLKGFAGLVSVLVFLYYIAVGNFNLPRV